MFRYVPALFVVLAALTGCEGVTSGEIDPGNRPAHCVNGQRDGDETYRDCGGSCTPCEAGLGCRVREDCKSLVCGGGFCLKDSCDDRTQNGDEIGIDCGGSCPACEAGLPCEDDLQCASLDCRDNICAETSCDNGEHNGDETDVDCGGSCPSCEDGLGCRQDDDCKSRKCTSNACEESTCSDGISNQGESAIDCGGPCDPCQDAQPCEANADCASGSCSFGRCISCADGLQNGDETGRDCGGSCEPCRAKEGCKVDADCESSICGEDKTCVLGTCDDGKKNQDESDTDCGGSCAPCGKDKICNAVEDCTSGVCTGGLCQAPSCGDGVRNGGESDVDCGGPTICDRCPDYRDCTENSDCLTSLCNDDNTCGPNECQQSPSDKSPTYHACGFYPMAQSCPDIRATGTSANLNTYDSYTLTPVSIGFDFPYYGDSHSTVTIQSHGALTFDNAYLTKDNTRSMLTDPPDDVIAAFWDDLDPEFAGAGIFYKTLGSSPNRRFVVQWDVGTKDPDGTELATFSAVLYENGDIDVCYVDTNFGDPHPSPDGKSVNDGRSATAGLFGGGVPFAFRHGTTSLKDGYQIHYWTKVP
ncbi:MAG: hypothetical protein KC416_08405 [Myxococcales bacterium]|nr:hypothetical protein [Myxococcales bacterium]